MEEMQKPSLGARIKAWPLWAKIIVAVVVVWLVVNVALFAVSMVTGHEVNRQFNNINSKLDK